MLNLTILLADQGSASAMSSLIMFAGIIAIFYFFMIRPQQKRQKELRKSREAMGKGDSVVTAGGIYGKIREVRENTFLIEIDSNVKIQVDKNSVYPSAADAAADAQK